MIWDVALLVGGILIAAVVLAVVAGTDEPEVPADSVDIKAMRLAMMASKPRPNYMWIGEVAAQALGLPGSGAYECVNKEWIKRGEL